MKKITTKTRPKSHCFERNPGLWTACYYRESLIGEGHLGQARPAKCVAATPRATASQRLFFGRGRGEVRMYQKQTFNIKYTQTNLWFQTKKNDSKKNPRRSFPPKFSYQNPATKKNIKTEENLNTSAIPTWEMDILLRQVGLPHRIAVSGLWQSPYLAQSSQWQNSSVFCLIKK